MSECMYVQEVGHLCGALDKRTFHSVTEALHAAMQAVRDSKVLKSTLWTLAVHLLA